MTVRLSVDEGAWRRHVDAVATAYPDLIPVVKGNGYGFGRSALMPHAVELSQEIAVGTVYEATNVPATSTAIVLTPTLGLPDDLPANAVLTVGGEHHVAALRQQGWTGQVVVKLRSTMDRYGVPRDQLDELLASCDTAGLTVRAAAVHLPLAGTDTGRLEEARDWAANLPADLPLWVSHLSPDSVGNLAAGSGRPVRARIGTALWHGDKSALHLGTDVLDVHGVAAGASVGYHATPLADDGWIVLAGAGSAHGVAPLPDGRSPFHFARRRLAMVEPPHMHTTMLFVPASEDPPPIGAVLDLQRPLITTLVDEVCWA